MKKTLLTLIISATLILFSSCDTNKKGGENPNNPETPNFTEIGIYQNDKSIYEFNKFEHQVSLTSKTSGQVLKYMSLYEDIIYNIAGIPTNPTIGDTFSIGFISYGLKENYNMTMDVKVINISEVDKIITLYNSQDKFTFVLNY